MIVIISFILLLSVRLVGIGANGNGFIDNLPKLNDNSDNIALNQNNGNTKTVRLFRVKENKVIELQLEEYIRGVVAAEMPASFEIEALKAQAVAARTYALAHIKAYGGIPYNEKIGADLYDTVECQVYMSKEERMEGWSKDLSKFYWDKITKAVNETAGQVLTYEGELVKNPYYFATSSGNTEDSMAVFKTNIPYLKSVESPGEEVAPKYKSTLKISLKSAVQRINTAYPKAKVTSSNLSKQIKIRERTDTGLVLEIDIGNISISGSKFRSLFNLNSSNFSLVFDEKEVTINCKGYGHGVGMSQWGANVMAKSGNNYKEILKHYYTGVKISTLN